MDKTGTPKTSSQFQTYWIVDGIRCESYATMEQRVLVGATAIEISAESQAETARVRTEQVQFQTVAIAIEFDANNSVFYKLRRALIDGFAS